MSEWWEIDAAWDANEYASQKLLDLGETDQWLDLVDEVAKSTRATCDEVWDGMAAALRGYLESLEGGNDDTALGLLEPAVEVGEMGNVNSDGTNGIPSDDTREKLSADCEDLIRRIRERIFSGRDKTALRQQFAELLDRQAAITEREFRGCPYYDSGRHYCKGYDHDVFELQAKVDELTRERDELKTKLDSFEGDCYCGATVVEWYEQACKLQDKVDELQAKADKLKQELAERNGAVCERDGRINAYERRNTELNDALKAICNRYGVGTQWAAEDAAKKVFETIDSAYMRLPVDADGVQIRPGDVVCYFQEGQKMHVHGVCEEGIFYTYEGEKTEQPLFSNTVSHVQPDTVEDALLDFAIAFEDQEFEDPRLDGLIEEYAERIRKACQ